MKRAIAVLAVLLCVLPSLAATRYAETFIVKQRGATTAIVLSGASVYVFKPGASANCATTCSGTSLLVYDSSNVLNGDTLEVGSTGLTATVTNVPDGTHITVNTSLTWSANDRFLRQSQPVTIYADAGQTVPLTQPTLANSDGRVLFYIDTSTLTLFDVKATVSTGGYRYINPDVNLPGTGSSAGGWTDAGANVNLSTTSDNVNIGGSGGTGKLRVYGTSTDAYTVATPAWTEALYNAALSVKWGWFLASNGFACWNNGTATIFCVDPAVPQSMYVGDMVNLSLTNPGTLTIKTQAATKRGLVIQAATSQSVNLVDIRDSLGNVMASIGATGGLVAGSVAGGPVSGTTGTFSGNLASATTVSGLNVAATNNVTATLALIGATLQVTGVTTLRAIPYTWPATNTSGILFNDGIGNLSWLAGALTNCSGVGTTFIRSPDATTATFYYPMTKIETTAIPSAGFSQTVGACPSTNIARAPALIAMKNLRVDMDSAAGNNVTITLLKNCSNQTVTCTINAGGTTCSDTTHQVSFAAGDSIAYSVVNSTSGAGGKALSVSWCWAN